MHALLYMQLRRAACSHAFNHVMMELLPRREAPHRDAEVIVRIKNMWFNPKLPTHLDRALLPDIVRPMQICACCTADLIIYELSALLAVASATALACPVHFSDNQLRP